jgi:hypothetical protein
MPSTRPIERFSRRRFWLRRVMIHRWRWRLSLLQLGTRTRFTASGDHMLAVVRLLRAAVIPALISGGIWFGIEVGCWWLREHGPDQLRWVGARVAAEPYDGLLGAGIGATATFLGLYWATVGVVASTVYASVPGDIRNLFVRERSGTVFVHATLSALILGLLQLGAAAATNRHPTAVGVLAFTALCGIAALWLVVLGNRLFNFFDSSTLASGLPRRFERAIQQAGARSLLPRIATDVTAHNDASRVLELLTGLAALSAARPARTDTGRYRLALYLLHILTVNQRFKGTVASTSAWWQRVPQYRNYFAVDHLRLTSALATSTGISPTGVTDYQWVERRVAEILDNLLAAMQSPAERTRAVRLLHEIAAGSRGMARQNLVREALTLRAPAIAQATRFPTGLNPEEVSVALAEAEPSVLQLTDLWLGFVDRCRSANNRELAADFTNALGSVRALYRSTLPRETITLVEELIAKRDAETVIAGRHITPMWWLHHFVARSVAVDVTASVEQILDASVDTLRIARLLADRGDNQRASVALFAALELSHKIAVHAGVVHTHLTQLQQFRRPTIGGGGWPAPPPIAERAASFREQVLVTLTAQLSALREEAHDGSRPDLYGQAYQVVNEAAWDYLLADRAEAATTLFTGLLQELDSARLRVSTDFKEHDPELRVELTAEPIIAVMDISGVAYLMQELNGHGIWDAVTAAWDDLIARGGPVLLRQLLIAGRAQEGLPFGPGQLVRTGRGIRLRQLLHERGIRDDDAFSMPLQRRPTPTPTPTVSVPLQIFADTYGFHDRPWQYFFVQYVAGKLPDDQTLPREVAELARQLQRRRRDAAPPTPEDED